MFFACTLNWNHFYLLSNSSLSSHWNTFNVSYLNYAYLLIQYQITVNMLILNIIFNLTLNSLSDCYFLVKCMVQIVILLILYSKFRSMGVSYRAATQLSSAFHHYFSWTLIIHENENISHCIDREGLWFIHLSSQCMIIKSPENLAFSLKIIHYQTLSDIFIANAL